MNMKFISKNIVQIDRELSDLDKFALDFIKVLRKYTKYVIISGYVSILLGRARSSEDIDIIIPPLDFMKLKQLLRDLKDNDFYCLNADKQETIHSYLKDKLAVRFAKNDTVIPNIELKFAKNKIDELTLNNIIKVRIGKKEIIISHLELQIAFKEVVLKSPKDMEDAKHIRNVAKEYLNNQLIEKYRKMLHDF